MIFHVCIYLSAHGGKDPILHTFCHAYKKGVQSFGLSDWLYALLAFMVKLNNDVSKWLNCSKVNCHYGLMTRRWRYP